MPPRPTPPDADDTEKHEFWCRDAVIAYTGGTLTTAYGNIAQVWGPGEVDPVSVPENIDRKAYTAKRTNTIGGDTKTVNVPGKTYKKYPRKNGGNAAAGALYTFITAEGDFTARVTGDVQSLVAQLNKTKLQQYISFSFITGNGATYGPFTNTLTPIDE